MGYHVVTFNPLGEYDKGIPFPLIYVEVLSSMIRKANQDGTLTGVPTSKKGPRVSYLFFCG